MSTSGGTAGRGAEDVFVVEQNLPAMLGLMAQRPNDVKLRKSVESMTHRVAHRQAYEDLVSALSGIVDSADDPVEVNRSIARILSTRLGRAAGAIERYEAILASSPDDVDALTALENLYASVNDQAGLLRTCEKLAGIIDDGKRRAALQTKAARILLSMGKRSRAEKLLTTARKTNLDALQVLKDIYTETDQLDKLADLLDDHPSRNADDILKLVDVRMRQGNNRAAFDNAMLLMDTPHRDKAVSRLERLLDDDNISRDAAVVLQRVYEERGDKQNALACVRVRLNKAEGRERRALLNEAHRLHATFSSALAILKEDPVDARARSVAEGLVTTDEQLRDLLEVVNVDRADAPILRWLLDRYRKIGDRDRAIDVCERLLLAGYDMTDNLALLYDMHVSSGNTAGAVDALRRRIAHETTPRARGDLTMQLSTLLEGEERAAALRDVLKIGHRQDAFDQLRAYYQADEDWERLADLLSTHHDAAVKLEAARLLENKLGRVDEAAEAYLKLIGSSVDPLPDLNRLYDGGLTYLYDSIRRVGVERGDYRTVARLMDKHLTGIADSNERARMRRELASVYRRVGDKGAEFSQLYEAEKDAFTRDERLWALANTKKRKSMMMSLYRDTAETVADFLRLGALHEELETGNAADIYWRALEIEKSRVVLDALLRVEARTEKAVEALAIKANITRSASAYVDLARVYQKNEDVEAAINAFETARSLQPSLEAVKALSMLYATRSDWEKVALMQEEIATYVRGKDEIDALWGAVRAYQRANMLRKAANVLESLLKIDKSGLKNVLELLSSIYEDIRDDDAYVKSLRYKADSGLYNYEDTMVAIARHHIDNGEDDKALAALRQALHANSAHEGGRGLLLTMLGTGNDEALALIEACYISTREYDKGIGIRRLMLTLAQSDSERIEHLDRIATMSLRANDAQGAFDALQALYELTPTAENEVIAVGGMLETRDPNSLRPVLESLKRGLKTHGNAPERICRAASVALKIDFHEAAELYQTLLKVKPYSAEALDFLDRFYTSNHNHAALITVLEAKMAQKKTVDLMLRVGRSLLSLGEQREACSYYEKIVASYPTNAEAVETYKRLLKQAGKWKELSAFLEQELAAARQ